MRSHCHGSGDPSAARDSEFTKNDQNCISNAGKVKNYAKRFLPRHWTFLGPGSEKRWYGCSYDRHWDRTANLMEQQFKEAAHLMFTSTSALSRGMLRERKGKSTIHFNGDFMNIELLVSNSYLCESNQCLRGRHALVLVIRFELFPWIIEF